MTAGVCGPTPIFPAWVDSLLSERALSALLTTLDALIISSDISSDSSSKRSNSILLALPAELRTLIYSAVLSTSGDDLSLLRTCQQVHMEASPVLYQRPINFPSQLKLFGWIERSKETDLKRVKTLSLRLSDIDLSSLLDTTPGRKGGGQNSAWSLYQREVERLDEALQSLPGLDHLVVVPPDRIRSQLLKGMYLSFLGQIPVRCPRLKQLILHDSEKILQTVPSLGQLASVTFQGTPATSSNGSRSPSDQSKSEHGKGRAKEVIVKMEVDEDS